MTSESTISRKITGIASQFKKEHEYWLNRLAGEPVKTRFPHDRRRTAPGKGSGTGSVDIDIPAEIVDLLLKLSKSDAHRLHVVLTAALAALLNKYAGSPDIIIGSPIYRQETHSEFVNTVLPLRHDVQGNMAFRELLMQSRDAVAAAVEHQNYPMEKLADELSVPIGENECPFFDTAIMVENIHDQDYFRTMVPSVLFSFRLTGQTVSGRIQCQERFYEAAAMEQVAGHFIHLLRQVLSDTTVKLNDVDILTAEERREILFPSFAQVVPFEEARPETLHQLFKEQADRTPDRIAVVNTTGGTGEDVNQMITYAGLDEQSDRLAAYLVSRGVGPGGIVAIMAERSIEMVVGLLAILKAGAAYLPISAGLPMARKRFMLEDSGAGYLLIQQHLAENHAELTVMLGPERVIYPHEAENVEAGVDIKIPVESGPDTPCYIIYTSGSTGTPKGVMLEHRGVVNYVTWAAQQYVKEETAAFPFYTSFSFDLTVTSIFTPLLSGSTCMIYMGDEKEFLIEKVLKDDRVEVIKLTPAHLKLTRDIMAANTPKARRFVLGGENLDTILAADIHRIFNGNIEIYNEYGPTETVVGSMIYKFDPDTDKGESVPIGIPIANTRIYILNERMQPVPYGVTGQMFISGHGVARGYLNRPGLTAEKFVDNPFVPGERMYATGDLAVQYRDGNMEFLGRIDHQVKIRGYRVELGEIEDKIKHFNKPGNQPAAPEKGTGHMDNVIQAHQDKQFTFCNKCLLPDNFPNVDFDDQGVCHHCREFEGFKTHVEKYFKTPDDFELVINKHRPKTETGNEDDRPYDCLLMFSGGKDSTYVLYKLVDMGLKVLTFTFDNGYISDSAFENIRRTNEALGTDHVVGKAEHMNHVFVESLRTNYNVCHGCWHALNTYAAKIANNKKIPLVLSGLSRGQIFEMRLEGLFQAGIFEEQEIEEKLMMFRKAFHSKENRFSRILNAGLEEEAVEPIQFIDFFRYYDTSTKQIRQYLDAKGWVQPVDTGFCSSNCLINDAGIYVYLKEQGFHFYAAPLSWDVRLGVLPREEGLKETGFNMDVNQVDQILDEIGYYHPVVIKDAVVLDKTDDRGSAFLCAYIVSDTGVSLSLNDLREYLVKELPDYMIPSYFVQVDEIPLTTGGKVDRKALLEAAGTQLEMNVTYVAPADENEKQMALVCQDVLKVEKIGINDNFFSLGATSFEMIQLSTRLADAFNTEVPVLTLFEYPTISTFLEHLGPNILPGTAQATAKAQRLAAEAKEEQEWTDSRKKGRNKVKNLRKRRKQEEDDF